MVRSVLPVCLMMLVTGSAAAAEQLYVNAQLALSKPSRFDSGATILVTAGAPIPKRKNLYLETELATTLLEPERDSEKLSYTSLGGYGIYQRMIDERLAVHGKVGMLYQYSEPERDELQRGMGIALGVGATLHHSRTLSYIVEGVAVQGTLDLFRISAGIRYRFR